MNIQTQMSWASFLVALSAFNLPVDAAIAPPASLTAPTHSASIEGRLSRISATLKAKESQLPEATETQAPTEGPIALGWGNGGRGTFVNSRRGGWGDRYGGGGFVNVNPWRNGWRDGGSFWNRGWPNGSFWNRY
ncbi:MAG: GrrA/OscA1 family cyclophane-containing rSAM-modified RiPP [Snowella sp.]|nr:GrrA/OscA1 family cyclophane-containing rSAM-modified RiPP [Snowella sp.]